MEKFENKIEKEKGVNIELILHILRHGDRTPDGILEEYGRTRTRDMAEKNSSNYSDEVIKIKSMGSPAGPKSEESEMQRSLETAHIYGEKIANSKKDSTMYKSRPKSLLNYEDLDILKIDPEYDYMEIFDKYMNKYLSEKHNGQRYEDISEEEQKKASFYASNEATKYYMELDTKSAQDSRKEVAGTFAILIKRYVKMMQEKLKSNQKFLFPLGSHTGMIEPFLAETVVWKNENGNYVHGATLDEMGGIFEPSEGFDIVLKTNQNSELEQVKIRFDNKTRFGGEAYLDMQKIEELAEFYRELHKNKTQEVE